MRALALWLIALPAWAETPLTGAEFAARVEGRTFAFSQDGVVFGHERYFPGARVIWEGKDGTCIEGFWRETLRGYICFSYQIAPMNLQCGQFFADGSAMRLLRRGEPDKTNLARAEVTDRPMQCHGPEVGA